MQNRTIKYNQAKVDRLAHIEEIFNKTMGWTKQLFNLYEERKALKIDVSRMRKPTNGK